MNETHPPAIESDEKTSISKPKIPRVMLTTKQVRILDKLVKNGSIMMDIKSASSDLGITRAAIYNSNKRVFQNFIGLLDAMITYYPAFERRFKHDDEILVKLRKLARKVKDEGLKI